MNKQDNHMHLTIDELNLHFMLALNILQMISLCSTKESQS